MSRGFGPGDLQRSLQPQPFCDTVSLVGKDVRGKKKYNYLKSVAEEERRVGAEEGKICEELEQSMQGIAKQVEVLCWNEQKIGPCFQFCQYLVSL